MIDEIVKFISDQLSVWPLASANFRSLKSASTKEFEVGGLKVIAQHNPCRIISSTAEIDAGTIAQRACFLCLRNRPKEQFHIKFDGRKKRRYNIQVNPYPIFPSHLVVARDEHLPQAIWHHFPDMMEFTSKYPSYLVFYNGPCSGASAPDHLHFQAVPRHSLPLENAVDSFLDNPGTPLSVNKDASLYLFPGFAKGVFALKARTSKSQAKLFYRLLCCCDKASPSEGEPRFNLYTYYKNGEYRSFVVLRTEFRSHHYNSSGADHLTMSPGAADMAGYFVVPKEEDFQKLTSAMLTSMVEEVTVSGLTQDIICSRLTRTQPKVTVGLLSADEIRFEIISDGAGPQKVRWCDGRISYNGLLYDELVFEAKTRSTMFAEPSFILYGIEDRPLRFAGTLRFIVEDGKVTAVDSVGLENYLLGVTCEASNAGAGVLQLEEYAIRARTESMEALGGHSNYDFTLNEATRCYRGLPDQENEDAMRAIDRSWGKLLKNLLCILALTLTFFGSIDSQARQTDVKTGLEVLRESGFSGLEGKRTGLLTNPTGVDSHLKSTIEIFNEAPEVNLVALYAPEHGVRGDLWAGAKVESATDKKSGLPVYSLYGATREPSDEMLKGVDIIVYDIQDIGCRSYTYISTLGLMMRACARNGVEVMVLDRPNPLGGLKIEGCKPDSAWHSFVGQYDIPYIYGLTVGELATLINEEGLNRGQKGNLEHLRCKLTVVPMKGWKREMLFADTGLPWVPTSPNIPYAETALCYPASGLCGEFNAYLNIGIGYTLPFALFAEEWIDADRLKSELDSYRIPGVEWRTVHYKPFSGRLAGRIVHGVQFYITDFLSAHLSLTQFYVMEALGKLYGRNPVTETVGHHTMFNKVCGSELIPELFSSRLRVSDIKEIWERDVEEFRTLSQKYYLYQSDL